MTSLEAAIQESWPTGAVRERTVDQVALCRVRTFDTDRAKDIELADRLELANRRALKAWLESGRTL